MLPALFAVQFLFAISQTKDSKFAIMPAGSCRQNVRQQQS